MSLILVKHPDDALSTLVSFEKPLLNRLVEIGTLEEIKSTLTTYNNSMRLLTLSQRRTTWHEVDIFTEEDTNKFLLYYRIEHAITVAIKLGKFEICDHLLKLKPLPTTYYIQKNAKKTIETTPDFNHLLMFWLLDAIRYGKIDLYHLLIQHEAQLPNCLKRHIKLVDPNLHLTLAYHSSLFYPHSLSLPLTPFSLLATSSQFPDYNTEEEEYNIADAFFKLESTSIDHHLLDVIYQIQGGKHLGLLKFCLEKSQPNINHALYNAYSNLLNSFEQASSNTNSNTESVDDDESNDEEALADVSPLENSPQP